MPADSPRPTIDRKENGELLFDDCMALPAEFLFVFTACDSDSAEIQLLLKRGEGGLYVDYTASGIRDLARALLGAAEMMEARQLAALPADGAAIN